MAAISSLRVPSLEHELEMQRLTTISKDHHKFKLSFLNIKPWDNLRFIGWYTLATQTSKGSMY